jgi:anti-sigma B factor antagonist
VSLRVIPKILQIEQNGTVTIVRFLTSDLSAGAVVEAVSDELSALVEEQERRVLLIDLGEIQKLSSSLLGRLIALHKRLLVLGGEMAICRIDPDIRKVFDVCQLPRLLHLYSDERDASAALARHRTAV